MLRARFRPSLRLRALLVLRPRFGSAVLRLCLRTRLVLRTRLALWPVPLLPLRPIAVGLALGQTVLVLLPLIPKLLR